MRPDLVVPGENEEKFIVAKETRVCTVPFTPLEERMLKEKPYLMERTNVRFMEADTLADKIDVATIDVAFISLDKVLPAARNILAADGSIIALIKPQFEAGKENVGKKGVVRDARIHAEVIRKILSIARGEDLVPAGLDYSPIKGPEGNIEFLLYLTMQGEDKVDETKVDSVVAASHGEL